LSTSHLISDGEAARLDRKTECLYLEMNVGHESSSFVAPSSKSSSKVTPDISLESLPESPKLFRGFSQRRGSNLRVVT
jgi:hypothetical protein